jgi:hypothetical protein
MRGLWSDLLRVHPVVAVPHPGLRPRTRQNERRTMNDEERQAQLDLLEWQIGELRLKLEEVGFDQQQRLTEKLAHFEARVQEWRRS